MQNEHIPCEHCGKSVAKLRMCKHIKTQKCQKSQKVNQLIQFEESVFQALEILEKHLEISEIDLKEIFEKHLRNYYYKYLLSK
jgi:phage FluMu protein Com